MFVILVYDVNVRRVSKMRKLCKKYLHPVQRSVFEGEINGKKLSLLQMEISQLILPTADTVCIYELDSVRYARKWQIGMAERRSYIL